jgi:hypothetical protein
MNLFYRNMKQLQMTLLLCLLMGVNSFAQVEEPDPDSPMGEWIVPTTEDAPLSMLTPPPTFEPAPGFNGYLSAKTSSAIIMILIKDANYISILEGITEEYFAENQLELISREEIQTSYGYNGVNFKLRFTLDNTEFVRYMTFIGDIEKTLWLNSTYPKMLEHLVEDNILKSIKSANLYPQTNE